MGISHYFAWIWALDAIGPWILTVKIMYRRRRRRRSQLRFSCVVFFPPEPYPLLRTFQTPIPLILPVSEQSPLLPQHQDLQACKEDIEQYLQIN